MIAPASFQPIQHAGQPLLAPLQTSPAPDVGTAVVSIVGAAMLTLLSLRLTFLAVRTRTSVARPQAALWEYFGFAGVVGVLYGSFTLLQHWLDVRLDFLNGLLLAFTVLFALAMREAYFNTTLANAELDRLGEYRLRRALEIGFVAIVLVISVGPLVRRSRIFTVLTAAAGFTVVGYGLYFQFRRSRTPATRGTLIDTLLRQTVPVLVFAGGALVAPALALGVASPTVASAVAAVFVVVTAASLMTVTIKLSQHLSSRR
ncbi:hypothetical protein L593_01430 [Salinarchaeum sp. Harcht-Bsk1]|uniref:hypothetical protein n=1 Tax=Salinarchaeum sp. Harcht-Bsk1 TaxID=1333523 RepID=UPI000342462A|nr:hypothetical protein [Salinarchaeum sp. Harcht-Bsk1]AGN00239.1 hypothetical protein L593_01430 [Salinarchaeum sp. Harcht-Bsk1]